MKNYIIDCTFCSVPPKAFSPIPCLIARSLKGEKSKHAQIGITLPSKSIPCPNALNQVRKEPMNSIQLRPSVVQVILCLHPLVRRQSPFPTTLQAYARYPLKAI
jgi:hypothetical protein